MRSIITTICIMAMAVLLFAPPSEAQMHLKKYTLYLATSDTGVTTPVSTALSGVTDPLLISDGGNYKRRATDTTLTGLASLPSGNAVLFIDTVTVSQDAQGKGGTNSGNTFFVSAKFGHAGSNFNLLEKVPLVVNMALSGPTPYAIPFKIPLGTEMARFYFGPSGITAYGNFVASLIVGLTGTDYQEPEARWISGVTCTVHSTSGVSTITVPDGARRATLMSLVNGIYYTFSAQETPSSQTKQLTAVSLMTMSAQEARKFRFIGDNAADSGVRVDFFTR